MRLCEKIGKAAMLEQTAEEAAELAKAALKTARALRNENPTPKSPDLIAEELHEEIADVLVCISELIASGIVDESKVIQ